MWSFVDVEGLGHPGRDRAGLAGIYNIVDDEPAPVAQWLPALAEAIGARPPVRIPRWIGRFIGGEHVVVLMNGIRGVSNTKAKRDLEWRLRYATWREGFRTRLGEDEGRAGVE